MADLDDIRDGKEYGVGTAQKTAGFFLKGSSHLDWGMKDRLSRIFNPATGRTVMLAFDHGFIMGPTSGVERIDLSIVPLIEYADCLMCARGVLRSLVPPTCRKPICLRSDAGTSILTELNHNVVIDVQDAVRLNASAIAVMVAVGDAATEAETVANLYQAVDAGQACGIPVMGVTAVGKDMARDARYFGSPRGCARRTARTSSKPTTPRGLRRSWRAVPFRSSSLAARSCPNSRLWNWRTGRSIAVRQGWTWDVTCSSPKNLRR